MHLNTFPFCRDDSDITFCRKCDDKKPICYQIESLNEKQVKSQGPITKDHYFPIFGMIPFNLSRIELESGPFPSEDFTKGRKENTCMIFPRMPF